MLVTVLALGLSLACAASADASDVPAWVRALAGAPSDARYGAVVLIDDLSVTVDRSGRQRSTQRYAVRINTPDGREAAAVRQVYIEGAGKVTGLKAWVMPPGGRTREYSGRESFEVALSGGDLYNEIRAKGIDASRDVEPGAVFAAEVESEESGLFAQLEWPLQDTWPVKVVRRTLSLPTGWTARNVMFNADPIDAAVSGSTFTWEFRDLPALEDEADAPPVASRAPRLAVSYFAPAAERAPGQFASWQDVAAWLHAASEPSAAVAEPLARTARELTAGADTDIDKIRAIAKFVQRVQYVSIQTGLGRGGGYQPRPAAQTLEKRYGDCKDKANLMRALLAVVGVKAHLVAIYAGDPRRVREEWPSPQQFNHCITAIVLREPFEAGAVLAHPQHGRLLFFDPTDEHGAIGDLPLDEQGSFALLQLPGAVLERVPLLAAASNRIERDVNASIAATGELSATVVERRYGWEATVARARAAAAGAADLPRMLERRVAGIAPGARLLRHATDEQSGAYTVTLEAGVPMYAQTMQGRLMVVPPPTTSGLEVPTLPPGTRRLPLDLETRYIAETITLKLPSGFTLDELPSPAAVDAPFGRFRMRVDKDTEGTVVLRRELETQRALIPPADYAAARGFFDRVKAAATTPIVLARN